MRKKGKHGRKNKGMFPQLVVESVGCGARLQNRSSAFRNHATGRAPSPLSDDRIFGAVLLCFNVLVNAVFTAPRTMAGTQYELKTQLLNR